jgi:hypothetical protein
MIMVQPDSPLPILRVDLSGPVLSTAAGSFERSGQHVVDVKNVSDRVLTDAEVSVHVGSSYASGISSGVKLGRSLRPGERTRLSWKSGAGRGQGETDDPVSVTVMVGVVKSAGCTYKPSQSWPMPADTRYEQ